MRFFNDNGGVNPSLLALARRHGLSLPNGTLAECCTAFQEEWFIPGQFRAQIKGKKPSPEDLVDIIALGLLGQYCLPTVHGTFPAVNADMQFSAALVLGGTVLNVRKRIAALLKAYKSGVQFKSIWLLGSTRGLFPDKESREVFETPAPFLRIDANWRYPEDAPPLTEIAMMREIWEQTLLTKSLPSPGYIVSGRQFNDKGQERMANTEDTIRDLEMLNLPAGPFLVCSSQPYVEDQTLAVLLNTSKGRQAHGIGMEFDGELGLEAWFDTIAKQTQKEYRLACKK